MPRILGFDGERVEYIPSCSATSSKITNSSVVVKRFKWWS